MKLHSRLLAASIVCSVTLNGCDRQQSSQVDAGAAEARPSPRPAVESTVPAPDIRELLTKWSVGEEDAAVAGVVELSRSAAGADGLRLYAMTEQQFAALPVEQRTALQSEMLDSLQHLRALAREIRRRASDAAAAGRTDEADGLIESLRALAQANSGPQVPLAVDMVAKAIQEKLVDPPLDAVPATAPTPSSP